MASHHYLDHMWSRVVFTMPAWHCLLKSVNYYILAWVKRTLIKITFFTMCHIKIQNFQIPFTCFSIKLNWQSPRRQRIYLWLKKEISRQQILFKPAALTDSPIFIGVWFSNEQRFIKSKCLKYLGVRKLLMFLKFPRKH